MSYWVHLFVQIEFIVLFCVRVESLDTLERTNAFLPLTDCTFLANKNCDSQTVKKLKSVAVGGHAPTATPTGKFCGKLCARNEVTSARFAVKFCRRLQSRAPPAADTARRSRGSGRRAQARLCAHRAMRTPQPGDSKGKNSRGRQSRARLLPLCSVSSFSTRYCDFKGIYKIVKDVLSRRRLLYLIYANLCETSRTALPAAVRASGTNP